MIAVTDDDGGSDRNKFPDDNKEKGKRRKFAQNSRSKSHPLKPFSLFLSFKSNSRKECVFIDFQFRLLFLLFAAQLKSLSPFKG